MEALGRGDRAWWRRGAGLGQGPTPHCSMGMETVGLRRQGLVVAAEGIRAGSAEQGIVVCSLTGVDPAEGAGPLGSGMRRRGYV